MDNNIAEAVLRRGSGYCERCGRGGENFHLHHRKLRSQSGIDHVSNLVAICYICHQQVHANPKDSKLRGWICPSYLDPADYPVYLPSGKIVKLDWRGNYIEIGNENGSSNNIGEW